MTGYDQHGNSLTVLVYFYHDIRVFCDKHVLQITQVHVSITGDDVNEQFKHMWYIN